MIKETFRRSVLHTADFTLQTINCTLVNAHCTLHCTLLYTLHTVLYSFGLFDMSDLHISYILTWWVKVCSAVQCTLHCTLYTFQSDWPAHLNVAGSHDCQGEEVGQQEVHKVVAGGREGEGIGAGAGAGARAGVKLLGNMNINIYKQQ